MDQHSTTLKMLFSRQLLNRKIQSSAVADEKILIGYRLTLVKPRIPRPGYSLRLHASQLLIGLATY